MAKRTSITPARFTEPPTGGVRAMLARFTALVEALVLLTDAERDLGGYAGQDPALATYTATVDTARAKVLGHCAVILAGETADEMAHGMQMMAKMVRTVLTSDKPGEVATIRNIIGMRHATVFFAPYRPGHLHYNSLMEWAFDALAAHIALPGPGEAAGNSGMMEGIADSTVVAHTGMSRSFTRLLRAMDRCVRAEQPLQRPVAGDVRVDAFGLAIQDAEAALADLLAALHRVMAADLLRREDRALWETGCALWSLISREDDGERQVLFATLFAKQPRFMVPGAHAVARRTREMQRRFFRLAADLMRLEDFGGPGPDGDGACGPALAA